MNSLDSLSRTLLIGDIGGTHVRFALADPDQVGFSQAMRLNCADYENIEQAIDHYLTQHDAKSPSAICLAVAGPVEQGQVALTNNAWRIDAHRLAQQFAGAQVRLVNDFAAMARSIPYLNTHEYQAIGSNSKKIDHYGSLTLGVIGPGTGLGVAGLVKRGGHTFTLASEAGHAGFAPETELQIALLNTLRHRFSRVSIERLLSGTGLENIHWALSGINKENYSPISAAEIFAQAMQTDANLAYASVQLFFEILGQAAGDLALVLQAKEGIFISGGMAQRYPDLLAQSRFRSAFENKGRFGGFLETIPTYLITHEYPGLLGASSLLLV